MVRWLVPIGLVVLGVGVVLLGLSLVNTLTRDRLRNLERYTIDFLDIACDPPPHEERVQFLSEVQYLTNMPSQIRLLEDGLVTRLAEAFGRHPWVEKVEGVEIAATRQVRVKLEYRTPVLAVPQEGGLRAVDRKGILLPANAVVDGLPVFSGQAKKPAGPAGTRWGDPAVEEAARQAGMAKRRAS
jgi:hypothetical protein